ncbi:hypothetical protein BCT69_06235 [Enterovibrio norvegicus]|nr:hypothetical protein BCT69_06235 [Enterovibrio norvegicus]
MERVEFFKHVREKLGYWYSVSLVVIFFVLVVCRSFNIETSQIVGFYLFTLVIPSLIFTVMSGIDRTYDLHKYFHRFNQSYKLPSIMSPKLVLPSAIVALATVFPPIGVISLFIDFGALYSTENTFLLGMLLTLNALSIWFFWFVNPSIKRLAGKAQP